MRNTKKLILTVIILFGLFGVIQYAQGYTGQKLNAYMKSPLPSAPEPVLAGESFPVTVVDLGDVFSSASSPTVWSGYIVSDYGKYTLTVETGGKNGETWDLSLGVPSDVHPGLYDISLTQTYNGLTANVYQNRSVWVLEEWPDTLRISHITDIHEPIGEFVLTRYILQSNFINPDLIIATGDIVQTESVARSWAFLQSTMWNIYDPSYLIPGNHDYSGFGGKGYQMYGGKLNYTLVIGDFVIVACDSAELSYLSNDQLEWLEAQLSLYPDKVKVVAFHHAFLSSEYEEDFGSVTGGYIDADWTRINELADTLYFTWKNDEVPSDQATNFLRIVQEQDVRLIMNGHVHRDMIYVVNDKHYFVTTSTSGGGLPPNSRYGSRLITLHSDGSIELDPYAQSSIDNPPNNIPHGGINYTYGSANDYTETAVSVHLENDLEIDISDGRLFFRVSGSKPASQYEWVGTVPSSFEVTSTGSGHFFEAFFDVPSMSSMDVTLKAADDRLGPVAEAMIQEYTSDMVNSVNLSVSDSGWGVKSVEASYSVDDGATWDEIDTSIVPILSGEVYDITFPELVYEFEVPAVSSGTPILVRATAVDYAGNTMDYTSENLVPSPKYTLTISSSPVDVTVIVDGESSLTPQLKDLKVGDYSVTTPLRVTVEGEEYLFIKWSDGVTENERTINLEEDLSLEITYEKMVAEVSPPDTEIPTEDPDNGSGIPFPVSYALLGLSLALFLFNQKKIRQF